MRNLPDDTEQVTRKGKPASAPERRCILTEETGERGAMIRLALGPDGQVAPDVRAKAPGRGAWIAVNKVALHAALDKGKLKGALARAFKTGPIAIPATLADDIAIAFERAALDRLGLEARAGTLLTGADRIDTAARSGQVRLLLHASDAAADGRGKRDQSWRVGEGEEGSGRQGRVLPVDRMRLSMALGRDNVVHIAIIDANAANRVASICDRWQNYLDCDKDAGNSDLVPDLPGTGPLGVSGN